MYTEKSDKNIPQVLYDIVGHQSEFATLAKNVSRGDMDAAKNELGRLGIKYEALSLKYKNNPKLSEIYKKYTIYIKQLQEDFDANATIWDTFMSGNKESRAQKNPAYDTVRTKAVIAAEGRLADKSGFPKPSDEKDFRVTGNYD